ncbi:MAG: hypothetical protein ACRDIE_21035 [Chloroflexota bacterium]
MGRALRLVGLPLAIALALVIRLRATYSLDFDGLYGQDSFAYYYHALALWRDHALEYHWPWLPTPTRLYWPLGYPALLAVAFAAVGHASAHAAQTITMLCGLAVTALTYALALRMARTILPPLVSHAAAACAAWLIACSGLQVQASTTIMSDAPALCWGMTALWLWTDSRQGMLPRTVTSFLAGVFLALAISTRYEYAPLIVAPAVYWWLARRHADPASPSLPAGLIGAVLAGAPQLIYSAGYSSPVLNNEWLTGWRLTHLWQASFSTPDGVQHYAHSVGAFYLLRPLLAPESLPWVLVPFLLLGLLALAWNCERRSFFWIIRTPGHAPQGTNDRLPGVDPPAPGRIDPAAIPRGGLPTITGPTAASSGPWLGLPLAWWLAPTVYLIGVPFESARFALIAQPSLAMLEGFGLIWTVRFLSLHCLEYARIIMVMAIVWAACGLAIASANSTAPLTVLAQGKASDQAAVTWVKLHAPSGSAIATFDLTLTLYHYGNLEDRRSRLFDLSALDAADWAFLARAPRVLVIANVGNLARQWHGMPPDQAFIRLVKERRLTPVAAAGVYTIYE